MTTEHFLLLSLADHLPTTSEPERRDRVPGNTVRCLNSAGRWAVHGTALSPLLVWHSSQASEAGAAAERSSRVRNQPVKVLSQGDSGWAPGREVRLFTEAFESALDGPAAQSSARARRLRTEADKLEAFCMVVRAASAATDHHAFGAVSRAASKALQARFGGGTITSAFAWLIGPAGQTALESVLTGEVELGGSLSVWQVVEAVMLAQQAERLQGSD